jgi:hypothetical protein
MESSSITQGNQNDVDPLLQELVLLVEKQDGEIALTLLTRGLVVFGILISGKKFFDGLIEGMPDNQVRTKFIDQRERHQNIVERVDTAEELVYVHLKNAQFPGTLSVPKENITFWRVKIGEVDGFSVGFPLVD